MLTAMNNTNGNSYASAYAGSSPAVLHKTVRRGEMANATAMQNASSFWGIGTAATAPALQAGLSRVRVPYLPP